MKHPCLALLAALCLGSPALAQPAVLQALTPTSGVGAERLLDGDPATGWKPEGDPLEEGVLVRLERPVRLSSVSATTCPGSSEVRVELFLDGQPVGQQPVPEGGKEGSVAFEPQPVRSVFLRLVEAKPGACLGELRLRNAGGVVAVAPPRRVAGRLEASSVLAPAEAYQPGYLFDGRTDFGWVEGAKGPGVGESLTLTLEQPVELVALELWNGYQRSVDHYRKNARAKQLQLSVDGGPAVALAVEDVQGPQRLVLPKPLQGRVWRLVVGQVYPGSKYPDMVLSELRLVDKSGPLGVQTEEGLARQRVLVEALKASPLGQVVGRTWRNLCEPEAARLSRKLKLRTNHTFVLYDDSEAEGPDESKVSEVTDGAWVVQQGGGPRAVVELYGRRHRTEEGWEPYADGPSAKETVRIAGGRLQVMRVADLTAQEFQKVIAEWRKGPQAERVACVGSNGNDYERLKAAGALFLQGSAVTDLFVAGR